MADGDKATFGIGPVNTLIAFCLGCAFIALVYYGGRSEGVRSAQAARNADHYAETAAKDIKQRCTLADPTAATECIKQIVEATREAQRSEYDLKAQIDSANWGFWALTVSTLGFAATLLGIWFVRENLIEMRRTRGVSEGALAAANATLDHDRQSNRQSLRAYAVIDDVIFNDNEDTPGKHVAFHIKNCGQTPAHITHAICNIGFVSGIPWGPSHAINGPVGPGNVFIYRAAINENQFGDGLANIINGITPLAIFGTFFYNDCFGEMHQTDFAFKQVGALKNGAIFTAEHIGNRAT